MFGFIKRSKRKLYYLIFAFAIVFVSIYLLVRFQGENIYHSIEDIPRNYKVAIVFGAGLWGSRPSPVLEDRIRASVDLYDQGKVSKILMSGDNRFVNYNEPQSMKRFAVDLGVSENDVVMYFAGRRTYDTCYRAHDIFGLDEAILVTQQYHLPRALYTCQHLGVSGIGFASDSRSYPSETVWKLREVFGSMVAWFDVYVMHPVPILGVKEAI